MKKRMLSFLLALSMVFSLFCVPAAAVIAEENIDMSFVFTDEEYNVIEQAKVGDIVYMGVKIDKCPDITGYAWKIKYDATRLVFAGDLTIRGEFKKGVDDYSYLKPGVANTDVPGTVICTFAADEPVSDPETYNSCAFYLAFRTKAVGTAEVSYDKTSGSSFNWATKGQGGVNITTTLNPGSLEIVQTNTLTLSGPTEITAPGEDTFTATLIGNKGQALDSSLLTWSVAPAGQGVSVDQNGKVTVETSATVGTYTVKASAKAGTDLDKDVEATAQFTVERAAPVVTSIKIFKDGTEITADTIKIPYTGETSVTYTAKVYDQFGDVMASEPTHWGVSNTGGVGTGLGDSYGTITIPATAKAGTIKYEAQWSTNGDLVNAMLTIEVVEQPKENISSAVIGTIDAYTYDGTAKEPTPTVTVGGKTLTAGTDFTYSYENNTNAGTATVTVTGMGQYTGSASKTFTINKASIYPAVSIADWIYGGDASKPKVTGNPGDGAVIYTYAAEGSSSFSETVPTDAGNYTVKATIAETDNYRGGVDSQDFMIHQKDIFEADIAAIADQIFTGSAIEPNPVVKDGDKTLVKDTDYTVSYSNNIDKGTATVTITGKGNYEGTKEATFNIGEAGINHATITVADQTYTGSALTPDPVVKIGDKTLTEGTDYTVSYEDNTNAGTATVTIIGKGNYEGTKKATFTINPKEVAVEWTNTALHYNGTEQGPAATAEGLDVTVSGKQTNAGTYTATAATTNTNYTLTNATVEYTIAAKEVKVEWSNTELIYTGVAQAPAAEVNEGLIKGDTLEINVSGKQINAGKNYEATAATTNTNYTLTNATTQFTIAPKEVAVVWSNTELTYNGQAQAPTAVAKDGEFSVAVTVSGQQTDVGDYTATAASANTNYTLAEATKTTPFSIGKANWTVTAILAYAKYGTAAEVDLTNYIAAEGQTGTAVVDTADVLENVAVSGGKLTFNVKNDETLVGETVEITIPVTNAKNHNDYEITVTVKISDKLPQSNFKFSSAALTKTYGDADFTMAATGAVSGSTVTYTSSDPDVATVDANGKVHILKIGTTTITANAAAVGEYDEAAASYVLTVNKKPITITAKEYEIQTGETVPTLDSSSYIVTGLVGNETLTKAPTVVYVDENGNAIIPDNSKEGTYAIKVSGAEASDNYTITYVNGKLTITEEEQNGSVPNPPAHDCEIVKFNDCDPYQWYHEGIDYVVNNGLMNGVSTGKFAPNANTTRAMIVTILWRLEGEPAAADASFTDVADGQWYSEAIDWASANGIVNGYSAAKFGPMDSITREQMAAILYRYADMKGYDMQAGAALNFADAGSVSSYATAAMQWAVAEGLINGVGDNTLNPQGTATRAQVATILMRFCENVAK